MQLDAGLGTLPGPQAVNATAMMGDDQGHQRDLAMAASTVAAITMRGGTQVSALAISAMLPHAVKQQLGSGDALANVLSMLHVRSGQPSNFNAIPVIYPQVSGPHSFNYAQQ
eukprot:965320-Rhodomonas_salina.1